MLILKMFNELNTHYKSLRGRVFYTAGKQLAIESVDFGGTVEFKAAKFISSQQNKAPAQAKVLEVRKCCLDFLLEAVDQFTECVPATCNIFKGLSTLHPTKVLNVATRVPIGQLTLAQLRLSKAKKSRSSTGKLCTLTGQKI